MSDTSTHDYGRLDVAVRSLLSPTPGGRSENQDNYLLIDGTGLARFLRDQRETVQQLTDWPEGHCRFAVLDGMGGHSQGRQAAERAVRGLLTVPATGNLGTLSDALDRLHLDLHRQMHVGGEEPGCTLTLLEQPPVGPALLFHVGDSRLYQIDDEQADYLTIDHIPVTRFALMGLIGAAEWRQHTHIQSGYQISQAFILGNSLNDRSFQGQLEAELFELHDGNLPSFLRGLGDRRSIQLMPGRTYLLASDGLWHLQKPLAFIDRWPELLGRTDRALDTQLDALFEELSRRTRAEPGTRGDNCTAIALRMRA